MFGRGAPLESWSFRKGGVNGFGSFCVIRIAMSMEKVAKDQGAVSMDDKRLVHAK